MSVGQWQKGAAGSIPLPTSRKKGARQLTACRRSLIPPTHNRAGWLKDTIESAKRAASSSEIIVVDDASTDGTPEVCRAIEGIRYIRLEQNVGVSAARNVAVQESACDLVAFLDDDDLRLPGSLDAGRLPRNRPRSDRIRAACWRVEFSLRSERWRRRIDRWGMSMVTAGRNLSPHRRCRAKRSRSRGALRYPLEKIEDYDLWCGGGTSFHGVRAVASIGSKR